jgi:hypothetical protein
VLKYGALMLLRSAAAQRHLVYMAPNESFADLWTRKAHADPDALKNRLLDFDDAVVDRKFKRFGTTLDESRRACKTFRSAGGPSVMCVETFIWSSPATR